MIDPKQQEEILKLINDSSVGTLSEALGIEILSFSEGEISAKMPVDHRTKQPKGLLHGGASLALAETIGSIGSYYLVKDEGKHVVGLEINGNHISSATQGYVYAHGKLAHRGRTTHIWQIKIVNEEKKTVCLSRFTVMIIDAKK